MRRVFCVLAPLLIGAYVFALWSDWFTDQALRSVGRQPIYSEPIDLSKPGKVTWVVDREKWRFVGKGDLSLSCNLLTLWEIPHDRRQVSLRIKIQVQGRAPGGEWGDRMIRDKYFRTDEPFSAEGSSLWESRAELSI